MLRKASLSYFIASIITIIVILIEVGIRSAVVSPFVLLDSNKNNNPKVLISHSLYQGDFLLTYQEDPFKDRSEAAFQLGGKQIHFTEIPSRDGISTIETEKLIKDKATVFLRRGFEPIHDDKIKMEQVSQNPFFSKYNLMNLTETTKVKTGFKHNTIYIILITLMGILFPAMLFLFFNLHESMKNLFTLFIPFVLAIFLPLGLNYYFLMGYVLSITGSYVLSIILSILVPSFLSILLTAYSFEYTTKDTPEDLEENEGASGNSFLMNVREQVVLFGAATLSLLYFGSYLLLPLSFQAKIMDNLFLFCGWYFALIILFIFGYSIIQKIINKYELLNTEVFMNIRKDIENKTNQKVNIWVKKDSKQDVNAWIYSFKLPFKRRVDVYVTEGVLDKFEKDEIRAILYHEMGHAKLKHAHYTMFLTLIVTLFMGISMYYARQVMLANGWWQYVLIFPVGVILMIFITEWLPKKISRLFEIQADNFAVSHLENKTLYLNTLIKLSSLIEEEDGDYGRKSEWRESHPSFEKRIENIKKTN
ncbi:M48 family metallopeptidase [Bacillus altitudinis]|uniref:M48 family metallopeptidase n=1 Tax=Bacillus altitudinis TaxID=293387 RepID=UPI002282E78F|nr:M48 family metallopeptidase [Bacillus altitudinis]MCY7692315.1 M48 family metallopeptidase [Bacillus altitudinis]